MIETKVYIVADLSGSMSGAREAKQREMIQEYVMALGATEKLGQSYLVNLLPFSIDIQRATRDIPASRVRAGAIQSLHTYAPGMGGGTRLRDAIGYALELALQEKVPCLIQVFTDGEDTSSMTYSGGRLGVQVANAEATGRITVAVAGPSSAGRQMAAVGISAGNFRAWDGSVVEQVAMARDTVEAVKTYATSRATGKTVSNRFYADANTLNTSAVRGRTKKVEPKEIQVVTPKMAGRSIADFFGAKFKAGTHYYEMVKPEYIQDDKELVVFVKGDNEYRLGSRSVRELLGLPETGKVRVHPGPTSDKFTLFVQSSSVNRKTVEGQTFLTIE
jgi:transposase